MGIFQKRLQQQLQPFLLIISTHLYTFLLVISTHTLPFSLSWHKIQSGWRLPCFTLNYPIYSVTKELATSSQFCLWMTPAIDWATLHYNPQGNFCKLLCFFANSLSHTLIHLICEEVSTMTVVTTLGWYLTITKVNNAGGLTVYGHMNTQLRLRQLSEMLTPVAATSEPTCSSYLTQRRKLSLAFMSCAEVTKYCYY